MTIPEYAECLENLLFESLDVETIANETFAFLNDNQTVELAQYILTNFDISFPNRDDENE